MATEYIAHRIPETGETQSIPEHLHNTAALAAGFGAVFGSGEEAGKCGLLHDVGKYAPAFQQRIRGANIRVDHAYAGALECGQDRAAAFCIAGHHAGLADKGSRTDAPGKGTLASTLARKPARPSEDYTAYKSEISPAPAMPPPGLVAHREDAFFYVHMLYSCLVDADWLDTEHFMRGGQAERGTGETLETLNRKLDRYVSKWWPSEKPLNLRRCRILRELMDAGEKGKGMFTLTVPTGGGKTVSSMAFALRHALKNGLRRIIYVIPYCSIIEQTQGVFEEIFGPENVVAHYANVEYPTDENGQMCDRDRRRYLAAENWDAPIILTTAVQFFESIFSNRPGACRKLHNIADSVIIFDEAQMLPVNYLRPCIFSITQLVKQYGCTAVLCTATQPSLGKLIQPYYPKGTTELCGNAQENHDFFRRVSYRYEGLLSDDALAEMLSREQQTLCIVNSRKQAQAVFSLLPEEGRYHLSTSMTPSHRRRVLDRIRKRLTEGLPCRVVSTSLIEAGVDVDFPGVYRAVAGLDSIIQAAGRCNREGRRSKEDSLVHIFDTETKAPPALRQNIAAARQIIGRFEDIASPEAVEAYFRFLLYTLKDNSALDEKNILLLATEDMAFRTVAEKFHLIENNTRTLYIPLGEGAELVRELTEEEPNRERMRKLGQHAVAVYEQSYNELNRLGAVQAVSENAAILLNTAYYREDTGLVLSPEGGDAFFG